MDRMDKPRSLIAIIIRATTDTSGEIKTTTRNKNWAVELPRSTVSVFFFPGFLFVLSFLRVVRSLFAANVDGLVSLAVVIN